MDITLVCAQTSATAQIQTRVRFSATTVSSPRHSATMRPLCALVFLASTLGLSGAVIGTNPPALPLTAERIAALPAAQQPAWRDYLARSARQRQADQDFLAAELKSHPSAAPLAPKAAHNAHTVPLDRAAGWYAGAEARLVADRLISFQTPAGGWSKNTDYADHLRQPGESYAHDSGSLYLKPGDNDTPRDAHWSYIGTFDNDATITELRFLAKVAARDDAQDSPYRRAFLRGLDYIFAAQFPNGGWPQVWPLDGGYHDAITFNDDALIHVIALVRDVAAGHDEYAFVPAEQRTRATKSAAEGLACILATQIVTPDGRRTVWCQQHDLITLAPTSARNYEMPALAAGESAGVMMFLMTLSNPPPAIVAAVNAAAAWFEKTALHGVTFKPTSSGDGRHLNAVPGAGPLWPRYSEIGSDRPLFGDRDKTIHDDVEEISKERRNGYAWFGDTPKRALEHYAKWRKAH
jgi:PelA/Pel-15E family pectate lyase